MKQKKQARSRFRILV